MIQPLAYVHPDAKIAKNVVIEPFTTISKNVEIGEGTLKLLQLQKQNLLFRKFPVLMIRIL